ncbi:hypothetical protein B0H17DRAFT_455269 [Mycena rosella]|uniref:Uncharacterized protein n=1 Tax=Mycena rosella TaxID=1033263 RepID=A0AAD7MAS9_MYCRO|nr:hypothetical protein B0H17DRAFT_455269 [Mycena rosella]
MPAIHRSSNGATDLADDADDFQSKAFMHGPTIEVTLGALELEFDKQLAAVMDNMFGDQFASLADLEPIATTSLPLSIAPPEKIAGAAGFLRGRESPRVSADSLALALSSIGLSARDNDVSPIDAYSSVGNGETITRTTNAARGPSSEFSHSVAKPPKLSFDSASTDEHDVIVRSTRPAAPLPVRFSASTHGSAEPTVRKTNEARQESVKQTTNAAPPSSIPRESSIFGEPTLQSSTGALDDQSTITRPTNPAASQPQPDNGLRRTLSATTPALSSTHSFGSGIRSPTVLAPVSSNLPQRAPGSGLATSYSTPATPSDRVVNEDVEMTCSDPQPELRVAFQGIQNQNRNGTLGSNFYAWQQSASALSWPSQAPHIALNSSAIPVYAPQVPTSAACPFEPATLYTAPNSYHAHLDQALPTPHPSIFELI